MNKKRKKISKWELKQNKNKKIIKIETYANEKNNIKNSNQKLKNFKIGRILNKGKESKGCSMSLILLIIVNIYITNFTYILHVTKRKLKKYAGKIIMGKNVEKFWKNNYMQYVYITIYVILLYKNEWKLKEILKSF
jgi:hypothetical protein